MDCTTMICRQVHTRQHEHRPRHLDPSYNNLSLSINLLPRSLSNLPTHLTSYIYCKGHNHIDSRRTGCIHWSCECYGRIHKAAMTKSPSLIECLLALNLYQISSKDGSLG